MRRALALAAALAVVHAAPAAAQFDPGYEASNFSKTNERAAIHSTPGYQALLARVTAANSTEAAAIAAADPERSFVGQTACWTYGETCAGDARLYDWQPKDYGQVEPVVFGARNGATLSGRVWLTRAGPARRPGVVIVNGSVQASETLYWFAAQTLAKAGYVVLTFDPQDQGRSDSQGEAPDQQEGFPAQSDGRPFFDGAQDALDFFLSTPAAPYRPRPSCNSGTSHVPKQARRAAQGLNAAYNPLWQLIDASRIGIAGHSFGAAGVSYVGQRDARVKAVVAWDALREPVADGVRSPIGRCVDAAERAPAEITKPALNLTADYFIPPAPNASEPDYEAKAAASKAYSAAGVDTGSIAVRGGTHYEFSWIPDPAFGATLRGADLTTWYTTAWFDAYVKGDPTAMRRLRTNRWRADAPSAAVDPDGDANMMSRYHRSRLDIGRGGERFVCEDLRAGCPGLLADDGAGKDYDYLSIVTTPDAGPASGGVGGAPSCVAAAAVQGASARPRGRGVRVRGARAHDGRGVPPDARRADHEPAARGEVPAPYARLHLERPRDAPRPPHAGGGVYTARFRAAGGALKHVTRLRRANGRYARGGTFRTRAGCGAIRDATLAPPGLRRPRGQAARHPVPAQHGRARRGPRAARQAHRPPLPGPATPGRPRVQAPPAGERDPPRSPPRRDHGPPGRRARPDAPPHRPPPLTEWHLRSLPGNADATRRSRTRPLPPYKRKPLRLPARPPTPSAPATERAALHTRRVPPRCMRSRTSRGRGVGARRRGRRPAAGHVRAGARGRPCSTRSCGSTAPRPGPRSSCPRALRGRRTLPVTVGALIRYRETPVGPYHEVLGSPVLLLGPARPAACVPFIAVDSLASVHGGRENWQLPKTLARFDWPEQPRGGFELDAEGRGWSVHATVRPRAARFPFAASRATARSRPRARRSRSTAAGAAARGSPPWSSRPAARRCRAGCAPAATPRSCSRAPAWSCAPRSLAEGSGTAHVGRWGGRPALAVRSVAVASDAASARGPRAAGSSRRGPHPASPLPPFNEPAGGSAVRVHDHAPLLRAEARPAQPPVARARQPVRQRLAVHDLHAREALLAQHRAQRGQVRAPPVRCVAGDLVARVERHRRPPQVEQVGVGLDDQQPVADASRPARAPPTGA